MADYPGANNQDKMTGNTKEVYAKKIVRFKKLKKLLEK